MCNPDQIETKGRSSGFGKRLSAFCFIPLCTMLNSPVAFADVLRAPSCDELASWSENVDPTDRWEPFPENEHIWLPNAMSQPEFDALFAKSALRWNQNDVATARTIWGSCIQQAKKARNTEQRNTLQTTRRFLTNNLRNVARYQERRGEGVARERRNVPEKKTARAEPAHTQETRLSAKKSAFPAPGSAPRLVAGVDQLIAAPPSIEGLIVLGTLSNLDIGDASAMRELERQLGNTSGPAGKAGYRVIRELRGRGTAGYVEKELPRINAYLAEVKPVALAEFEAEFSQNPSDLGKRRALAQRYEKLMQQLQPLLTEEEYLRLANETRSKRRAVVDRAVANAKEQIDQVPLGDQSIKEIDRIVSATAQRGLDGRQRRELANHARSRQRTLANQLLTVATEKELPALPNTLAGVQALNAIGNRMLRGIVQKADRDVIQGYVAASEARLATIARAALPEYEQQLARLAENEAGLEQVQREIADKEGWMDLEEGVRGDYVAAAAARHEEIGAAVQKAHAQRLAAAERERKRSIAAGGDPRLVGTEWVDANHTMKLDFRDQETVFVTAVGFKFAGTYKVSRDDVVVQGPHGQLVYTFTGETLLGNRARFQKRRN